MKKVEGCDEEFVRVLLFVPSQVTKTSMKIAISDSVEY